MCCISSQCKYFQTCQRSAYLTSSPSIGMNWGEYGSGAMTVDKFEVTYYCGELGNYSMYIPSDQKEGDNND